MKKLLFVLIFLPHWLCAHCPFPVEANGESYCMDLSWDQGEKKVKGQFESTEAVSPVLNTMGSNPQKWVYSKAVISVWKEGDHSHTFVEIPGFRVFPFMEMENGHNHSAGYEFTFDTVDQVYLFQRVAFQQMRGCWSLRWTIGAEDLMETSQLLSKITEFSNLSEEEVVQQALFCGI